MGVLLLKIATSNTLSLCVYSFVVFWGKLSSVMLMRSTDMESKRMILNSQPAHCLLNLHVHLWKRAHTTFSVFDFVAVFN